MKCRQCFQSSGFIRKSGHFPILRRSFWEFFEKSGHFCVYWVAKNPPDPALTNRPDLLLSVNPWNDTSGYPNTDIWTVSEKGFFLARFARTMLKKHQYVQLFYMDRWVSQFFHQFLRQHFYCSYRSSYFQNVKRRSRLLSKVFLITFYHQLLVPNKMSR